VGWWNFLQASPVGRIFHRRWTVKIRYPLVSYTSTSVCWHTHARACACTQTHTHLHTLPTIFPFSLLCAHAFCALQCSLTCIGIEDFLYVLGLTYVDQNFYRHLSHSLAFERIRMHTNACVSLHTHMPFSNENARIWEAFSERKPNVKGKRSFAPRISRLVTFCDILWHFKISHCHTSEFPTIWGA